MNRQNQSRRTPPGVGHRRAGRAVCGFLFIVSIAASAQAEPTATPFQGQLRRVEEKLSLVKMDIIHMDQSAEAVRKASNRPRAETDLQTIAVLMKDLEQAADQGKTPAEPGRLSSDEMQLRLAEQLVRSRLVVQVERTLKDLAVRTRRESIATEAWFQLEKLYYRRGDYPQALGAFFKIKTPESSQWPSWNEAVYLAGNSYLYLKEYRKATELLNKIGRGSDDYPYALYSMGLADLKIVETGSSTPVPFEKLMALNTREDPVLRELVNKTRVTLGFAFLERKRYKEAAVLFEAIPSQSQYWPEARSGIGRAYLGMEKCVKAIVIFRDLIEQAPTHPYGLEARLYVGSCYAKMNAYRRSVDSYQSALQTYAAERENLKKRIQKIQAEGAENLLLKPGSASMEKPSPAFSSRPDLVLERDFPELIDLYADGARLEEQIAQKFLQTNDPNNPTGDPVDGTVWEPIQARLKDIRRNINELLKTAATDHLSIRIKQIDDLVVRANVGIAKNTILMQDYGTAP
ncbi:MAG: tetratricopeptide repeat protein [Nitrospirae bacterium]|nr:tetratricopeptide repeat protein [Nitrospirota bacterium]